MPNHVTNIVSFKWNPNFDFNAYYPNFSQWGNRDKSNEDAIIKSLIEHLVGDNTEEEASKNRFDFNKVIPCPLDLYFNCGSTGIGRTDTPYYFDMGRKYGLNSQTSLDWMRLYWGTKWNAYATKVLSDTKVRFQTAWSTPTPVIKELSKHVPYLLVTCKYADEDLGHNVGTYTYSDGKVINEESWTGELKGLLEALLITNDTISDAVSYAEDSIAEYESETDESSSVYREKMQKVLIELLAYPTEGGGN